MWTAQLIIDNISDLFAESIAKKYVFDHQGKKEHDLDIKEYHQAQRDQSVQQSRMRMA